MNQLQKDLLKDRIMRRNKGQLNKFVATESAPTRYLSEVGEALSVEGKQVSLGCKMLFIGEKFVVFCASAAECDEFSKTV